MVLRPIGSADTPRTSTAKAWLYIRGSHSVRIVTDGRSLAVHGPGELFRRCDLEDAAAAALEHASLERDLVRDGWSFERMTTKRRSRGNQGGFSDRRRALQLVPGRPPAGD